MYMDDELAFLETATAAEQDIDGNLLLHQLVTSPLLTYSAFKHCVADFPSRGLLGTSAGDRVYVNTNAPSSAVICGVQGSGKSHTVACLLECALIADPRVGRLPAPLSALVFHFDTQDANRPCEAAFLSAPTGNPHGAAPPQVTVLCSPSNVNRRRRAYASLAQVHVEPLSLSEKDLTADRMLALMGCDNLETMPLYMHTALLIIRDMGIDAFSYLEFKRRIGLEQLNPMQRAMIKLRLDLLDAFVRPDGRNIESYFTTGGLVLVDLTDPFLDGLTAGVLFDIVLGAFTQWQTACGKLVVLDEAHKYLTNNDSARLTQSVGNIIRLQRHLATRVIIATQEPTVIPATILDLASIIICHRFSSPAWCTHLARHVSAGSESAFESWYQQVMLLPTGDALVFSPAALIAADEYGGIGLLGKEHFRLRVRPRLTMDGGASRLAVAASPLSLPTPPTSASYLPARHLQDTSTAPPNSNSTVADYAMLFAPFSAPATSPAAVDGPIPAPSTPLVSEPTTPPVMESTAPSIVHSTTSAPHGPASAPRMIPARLKYIVRCLSRSGAADTPRPLGEVRTTLLWMEKRKFYKPKSEWWTRMLQEAVDEGLIEVIDGNVGKKAAGGEEKIRLLNHGPVHYV
ncbi:hypothetical protein DFH09DRAFT_1375275 [Mycena vulgaris]|nr:hypothetical protein DFH09DRAFT_1375275 [Mycena vulgaris]